MKNLKKICGETMDLHDDLYLEIAYDVKKDTLYGEIHYDLGKSERTRWVDGIVRIGNTNHSLTMKEIQAWVKKTLARKGL